MPTLTEIISSVLPPQWYLPTDILFLEIYIVERVNSSKSPLSLTTPYIINIEIFKNAKDGVVDESDQLLKYIFHIGHRYKC